jgi:hypothetical protein
MPRPTSKRSRASPKAALVPRKYAPLAEFFERVGAAAYGVEWPVNSLQALSLAAQDPPVIGSDAELALTVVNQVLEALRLGKVHAAVPLAVQRQPLPSENSLLDDEDDDGTVNTRVFQVAPAFWAEPLEISNLDWKASQTAVQTKYLREMPRRAAHPMRLHGRSGVSVPAAKISATVRPSVAELYGLPERISSAPLWILRPDAALRAMYRHGELPDEAWFARYKVYRKNTMLEVIAAAWRYLAVRRVEPRHGVIVQVVAAMKAYLETQGVNVDFGEGPSAAVLQEIATRVVKQWKEENLSASVLVSTNPRRPKN